nr:hypothetical protein BaRGS_025554 [Batillaria attramentaria]
MPLTKRIIEPVNISRVHVPSQGMRNELECVTNHTLANVIRQLSSLSRLAEDMFSELTQETTAVFNRASQLQRRIENVQDKVTQLNATVEEVNLQDIHLKKPFKSSVTKEQQVISRSTVPRAILEIYSKCDTPPALDKLNTFREDGKDSMKFYTDPTYFVELWVQEMDKQIQENKSELSKKRERRRPYINANAVPGYANHEPAIHQSPGSGQNQRQSIGRNMVFAPPINGHLGPNDQGDSASVSSASTSTGGREDTKQAQGNDRSALLAEIIAVDRNKRLRKVEDREQKKKHSSGAIAGGFDIQALMERARDMRRRVIEDSDDDEADAGSAEEDNWDSD